MESKAVKRKSSEMATIHDEEKKLKPTSGISINLSAKPAVPKVNLLQSTPSSKMNMQISLTKKPTPIAIKLGAQKQESEPLPAVQSSSVAAAFNEDSDEDLEEMPKSAKMRMKNIGRDTPTSSGPKSFNKSKSGFQNTARNWEREIDKIARQNDERSKES